MATAAPTSTATRDPADPSTIERQLLAAVAELEPGLRSGGQAAEAARDLGAATVAGLRERIESLEAENAGLRAERKAPLAQ